MVACPAAGAHLSDEYAAAARPGQLGACAGAPGEQILVVRDPVSVHILPGGRREPGETLMQTLEREVLEEPGWTIQSPRLIGLAHFQHLTPKPDDYRYPYPDFLHLIYAATADRYDAGKREVGGYELESGFQPLATVEALPISQGERALLRAAMTLQGFD